MTIYRNTITGERIPFAVFPTCENGCPCDEYLQRDGKFYCPYCETFCDGETRCLIPPKPYEVDGDYWFFRPLRPDEDPDATDDAVDGSHGFVTEDRTRLYIRGLEFDPCPAVPFEKLGFPKHSELFHGDPE